MTARHWRLGNQREWHRFLFLSLLLGWIACTGVEAVCPDTFQDIDPGAAERCVAATTTMPTTLPAARLACQALAVGADLIKIEMNDVANLMNNFNTDEYWVGLNDADIPTAFEWSIDCTRYSAVNDVMTMEGTTCGGNSDCFCSTYQGGMVTTGRRCLPITAGRLALCAIAQPDDFPPISCENNYVAINDRCYRFYTGPTAVNFAEANAVCVADGGTLARINQYDCNFAAIYQRALTAGPTASFLIGLMVENSNPIWRDGTGASFLQSSGTDDCFELVANEPSGQYNRRSCSTTTTNYICEQAAIEPTTVIFTTADPLTTVDVDVGTTGATPEARTTAGAPGDATTAGDVTIDVTTDVTPDEGTTSGDLTMDVTTAGDMAVVTTEEVTGDATTSRPDVCCPAGSAAIGANCFAIITTGPLTFDNSRAACATLGGVLARVDPPTEVNQYLLDYFNANPSAVSVWIGLSRAQSGPLTWVADGTTLVDGEGNWATGEPGTTSSVNCAYSANGENVRGLWFLSNCFQPYNYLCQFNMIANCDGSQSLCDSNPCDTTGPGQITCTAPQFNQVACMCQTGFELMTPFGPCRDINECNSVPCDAASQDCVNTEGSFMCNCKDGLQVNPSNPTGPCIVIDPCASVTCDTTGPGPISCVNGNCLCTNGYRLNGMNGPCINVNECADPATNDCDTQTTDCEDNQGSFACNCKAGFQPITGNDRACVSITTPCVPNNCNNGGTNNIACNTVTGACFCPTNYELFGGAALGPCVDINECSPPIHNCITTTTSCNNIDGGFTCECLTGYERVFPTNPTFCTDFDECALSANNNCDTGTTQCLNTVGSFTCVCLNGYQRLDAAQTTFCTDIDECTAGTHNCDVTSTTCQNAEATFTCQCIANYVPITNVPNRCEDRCTAGQSSCDLSTTSCLFSGGAITCPCLSGFEPITGSTTSCQAIATSTVCCPRYPDGTLDNRLHLTTRNRCVFLTLSSGSSHTAAGALCPSSATTLASQTGLTLTGAAFAVLNDNDDISGLRALGQQVTFSGFFPPRVFVNFQRANPSSNYIWGDSTVFPAGDPAWAFEYPQAIDAHNCGALSDVMNVLGFVNVDCVGSSRAFCTVDTTTTNCPVAFTARVLVRASEVNGPASCSDESSAKGKKDRMLLTGLVQEAVSEPAYVRMTGCTDGSMIAHMEVTVLAPQRILNYEQLEEAILNLGDTDENGFITVTTPSGDVIVLDSNRLEVDDISNHVCHENTCQNGGTCQYDEKLIEADCRCMEEFEGSRCEAIKGATSTGVIVLLAVAMVVMVIVFASCCCCLLVLSRKRSQQNKNKMVYQYRPPLSRVLSSSAQAQRDDSDQQVVVNRATAGVDPGYTRRPVIGTMPRVVRNRHPDQHDPEMPGTYRNPAMVYDEDDEEEVGSSADQKRLNHFERIFQNANDLNSRMSYRGDAASVLSQATSSSPSIYKPPLSDVMEMESETREFNTPYTADGTENI